jgi:hypothetical protein
MKRVIIVKKFVRDLRSGFTDVELMETYRVNEKELRMIFRKLVEKHLLMPDELPAIRPEQFEDTIVFDKPHRFGE